MNYRKEYLGVIPGYDVDAEGFSSIPPSFSGDLNMAVHPPSHLAHGKRTVGRSAGPRIRSISTGGRPTGPHTHKKNVPKRPSALNNNGDDDSDINVCPPPSINGHGNITVSPPGPFILGTNMAAHPPGPPIHGFNTPVRPPRMPIYTPLYTPHSSNRDSNPAVRPPGRGIQKSRMPIYTPLYTAPSFDHNSNAIDNSNDDDSDVNVCPPPFIDGNGTVIIGPPCPVTLETNIAVNPPGHSAHKKRNAVRLPTSSN